MRKLYILTIGLSLSMFLAAQVNAAPRSTPEKPRQTGIQNAKKAMKAKLERDKKMHAVRKNGQTQKRQLQSNG